MIEESQKELSVGRPPKNLSTINTTTFVQTKYPQYLPHLKDICCDSQANMLIFLSACSLYGNIVVLDSLLCKNKTRTDSYVVL